jgi:hypothetical protein
MKRFLILLPIFIVAIILLIISLNMRTTKEAYLPKEMLDSAMPIDVTINLDKFKEIGPAYDNK